MKQKDIIKSARKDLVSISKKWYPWDYGFIMENFITQIYYMREFYRDPKNCHGLDIEDHNRYDICNQIIELWTKYNNAGLEAEPKNWNDFWELIKKELLYLWD